MKNPVVDFEQLEIGDVFMTLNGDVLLKLTNMQIKNAFCFNANALSEVQKKDEVVPVEAEISLYKNTYEQY